MPLRLLQSPIQDMSPKPMVKQAPPSFVASPPASAMGSVGTVVRATPIINYIPLGGVYTNPVTGMPVAPPPETAVLQPDQVGTTSLQSGDNPGPIPPVGTFAPKPPTVLPSPSVAPNTKHGKSVMLAVLVILAVWFFLGFSFKGTL